MRRISEYLKGLFRYSPPLSILTLAPKPVSDTSKLFVLRTDFPVSRDVADKINAQLEPLRQKFGLDFLVLEPGMNLTRFDAI